MLVKYGEEIKSLRLAELITELFPADEGEISQIYGRIGSGKTYCATKDILDDLNHGKIVYCNWKVQWNGYDERDNWFLLLLGFLGLKRNFYKFDQSNLHYFPITNSFTEDISKLTDCKIYLDEGHIAFDSYVTTRMPLEKRAAILHTRHFNRAIIVVSQRPTAIHVTLRANVNRFYKCEKILDTNESWLKWFLPKKWRLQKFQKTEFQDTLENDAPNEKRFVDPKTMMETQDYAYAVSIKKYWGRKKYFEAYDTKYMRGNTPTSQENNAHVIHTTPLDCGRMLAKLPTWITKLNLRSLQFWKK